MNSNQNEKGNDLFKEMVNKISDLEKRVARLEENKAVLVQDGTKSSAEREDVLPPLFGNQNEGELESSFGEYGMAWLGNIVLLFGFMFIIQFLQAKDMRLISPLFGFFALSGVFGLAYYFRKTAPYIARIFDLNGYLLLFYIILKLHFFNSQPVIGSEAAGIILLLGVVATLLYISVRRDYPALAGISFLMLSFTAVISDSRIIMLSLASLNAIVGMVLLYKRGWIKLIFLSLFLSYLICMFWILGNPLMGKDMTLVAEHNSGFFYIFLIAAIYSLIALMPKRDQSYSEEGIVGSLVFNGVWFTLLLSLAVLTLFKDNYVLPMASVTGYAIIYSIILKVRSEWKITPALYALFGFIALSITLYGQFGIPRVYFLLVIQSLFVVSMALWFRSKFIIIMNSFLFIILLLIYFSTSDPINNMNISLSLVALATARILNWKKERLDIKTDLIRNLYLIIAFGMVLYTLYKIMPGQYVTFSWTAAALAYFLLSLLLKNVKYRYMALGTLVAATLHLFLSDLSRIDLIYRIVTLLFLAAISIGLSLYYSRTRERNRK